MLGDDGFANSPRRRGMQITGKRLGAISAVSRRALATAGADKIKDRWAYPSSQRMRDQWGMQCLDVWPTAVLLAEAGISADCDRALHRDDAQAGTGDIPGHRRKGQGSSAACATQEAMNSPGPDASASHEVPPRCSRPSCGWLGSFDAYGRTFAHCSVRR
jgi:hypothetical protein